MTHFQKEVLERSHTVAVVVDFWAPWCGPCQFLGPVIEELASQAAGKWELVKVNTDEHQDLSGRYGIRGIPAVKMFYKGEVIADFTGALPKHQIQQWLDTHLPDQRKEELQTIQQQLFTETHVQAVAALQSFAAAHPEMEEARLWLAAATVGQQAAEARQTAQSAQQNLVMGEDILSLADLMECREDGHPKVLEKIQHAQQSLQQYQYEPAIQALIEATMLDKHYCNELPRRAAVALFRLMGNEHPLSRQYRRQFDMSLY